ncbi:hypothetical protein INR49_010647 [Caranx melampygus]|nr:hypothetical protein INR49_010647 [Caranx melampygus]
MEFLRTLSSLLNYSTHSGIKAQFQPTYLSYQITAATHLQHSHRLSTARTETSLHDSLILHLSISSTGNNPATPTAIQESLDSHDLGRPSATAQTRDQLTARWLDLTIRRAGGLSAELRLKEPHFNETSTPSSEF